MSIHKDCAGEYFMECDICGEVNEGFDSFQDAVDSKKTNGWVSRRINNEWHDVCPECKPSYPPNRSR